MAVTRNLYLRINEQKKMFRFLKMYFLLMSQQNVDVQLAAIATHTVPRTGLLRSAALASPGPGLRYKNIC